MKVWILTAEYNAYDQYGEYFVEVFGKKPTSDQLIDNGVSIERLEHVLNGGGRVENEDQWFFLRHQEI